MEAPASCPKRVGFRERSAGGRGIGVHPSRLDELVARTPPTRDRFMDLLRAVSICAVVFGHWFIGLISWERGLIGVRSRWA